MCQNYMEDWPCFWGMNKNGWCPAWTGVTDAQGDKIGDWVLQVDFESFKCKWCGTVRRLLVS